MRTPVLLLCLLLAGCYGRPELPAPAPVEGAAPDVDAAQARPTPVRGPAPQEFRLDHLRPVLDRLTGASGQAAPQRPGAATWRPAELEKLHELLLSCCKAEGPPCRSCADVVSAADLPRDELLPLAGRFLGPLRPQASYGLVPLVRPLLESEDPESRDRAHRLLVGSGLVRRTPPGPEGFTASSLPPQPDAGASVTLFVERMTPCPHGAVDWKGPDERGRLDVTIEADCPPLEQPEDTALAPRVHRIVATRRLEALPPGGVTVHSPEVGAPLLTLKPGPSDPKPTTAP